MFVCGRGGGRAARAPFSFYPPSIALVPTLAHDWGAAYQFVLDGDHATMWTRAMRLCTAADT